jgi:hypothetical protein
LLEVALYPFVDLVDVVFEFQAWDHKTVSGCLFENTDYCVSNACLTTPCKRTETRGQR